MGVVASKMRVCCDKKSSFKVTYDGANRKFPPKPNTKPYPLCLEDFKMMEDTSKNLLAEHLNASHDPQVSFLGDYAYFLILKIKNEKAVLNTQPFLRFHQPSRRRIDLY